jgi:hypothetical protein
MPNEYIVILRVSTTSPITDEADKIAQRAWSMDGVIAVEHVSTVDITKSEPVQVCELRTSTLFTS